MEITPTVERAPWWLRVSDRLGGVIMRGVVIMRNVASFALITVGVTLRKWRQSRDAILPVVLGEIQRSGIRLLPMVTFMAAALGLVIIGQTVNLLTKVGVQDIAGMVMVTVVVRELGPLVTALLVLTRIGTRTVIELSTRRAMGEVEALEALGIDPIHFLVMPRVIGLSVSIFALTVYFIILSLLSGFLFTMVQDVALTPSDYFTQIALALRWEDFILLTLKTLAFGIIIATVSCYQGLAFPVRLEDVPRVTTRAVAVSVVACVMIDAAFIAAYLVLP